MKLSSGSGKAGFTLMEILIVLIILGVLAGLAIPAYQSTKNRSKSAEAMAALGSVRQSMLRFHAANGSYTAATTTNLDYNPNATRTDGTTSNFTYTLGSLGTSTFLVTATPTGASGLSGTATIKEDGTTTNTVQ